MLGNWNSLVVQNNLFSDYILEFKCAELQTARSRKKQEKNKDNLRRKFAGGSKTEIAILDVGSNDTN